MGARAWTAAVVLAVTLAGCGDAGTATGPRDSPADAEREWALAGDPDATAEQIARIGRPSAVAATAERTVITYRAEPEDDEGAQQGAWRMYDADGRVVADGKLGIVHEQGAYAAVFATGDGFLIENYTAPSLLLLDEDGTATPVPTDPTASATRTGDLLVSSAVLEGWVVFHAATGRAAPLPGLPSDNPQSVRLDEAGTVWMLRPWTKTGDARIAHAAAGVAPWTTEAVPIDAGSYPVIDIAVAGGRVLLFTAHDGADEYPVIDALWSRPVTPDGRWERIDLGEARFTRTLQPGVQALPDGRLLLAGDDGPAWLQRGDGGFEAVDPPDGDGSGISVAGDDWYLRSFPGRGFLVSHDEGGTWKAFER